MKEQGRSESETGAGRAAEESSPVPAEALVKFCQGLRAAVEEVRNQPDVREMRYLTHGGDGWTRAFEVLDKLEEYLDGFSDRLAGQAETKVSTREDLLLVPAESPDKICLDVRARVWEISSDVVSARHGKLYPGIARDSFLTALSGLEKDVEDCVRKLKAEARTRV